ncbi:MAG: ATP-dependent 6-phosphofructokinase [Gammaproteobacteria bacterium]|nr:ATP-dependent 6-phosphofructokinase [Gammaproteobacteria bacterium]
MKIKHIGVLTGGGDCPGLNAVIRAVTKTAILRHGWKVTGILDGYEGLIENRKIELTSAHVSGILTQGGTILGTSNIANPFAHPVTKDGKVSIHDYSKKTLANIKRMKLDALVSIGGDGTMAIADRMGKLGVKVVGIPKTIDNDLAGTDVTFGYDTAVQIVTDALDRLHTTAQSHHRVMVLEVMGRYAGWLALNGAISGGGDIVLIPEIPFSFEKVIEAIHERRRNGKRFSLVVVAEGAAPKGGEMVVKKRIEGSPDPIRLGGIGKVVSEHIESATGISTRYTVLGHIQRGGTPTAMDRRLGSNFGTYAVGLIAKGKFGRLVVQRGDHCADVPITSIANKLRKVTRKHPTVQAALGLGMSFGE